jgi:hypothetical protein
MKVNEYGSLMERSLPKGKRILARGKPGVGKTAAAKKAAERLGMDFIGICCPLQSPVKIGGYPRPPAIEGGDASHCLFDGIAKAFRATKPTLLFWDDLGMAGGETLKALVEMVQFGKIDNRFLPECVVQCGATNDVGHGADVQGLIEPLKTRWHTIIEVETNVDDVVGFGLANGWPSDLCAFLRNAPDALHDWKPSKSISIDGACPRGWEYVAGWINDGEYDSEVISGCVGKGRATQYLAFRELINELPDVDSCLLDPESAKIPGNPSAQWLVSMALASKMTAGNFGQAVKYLNRLPAMFRAFSIRDAFRAEATRRADKTLPPKWAALSSSRDFTAWAVSSDGKDVLSAAS